jgi:hypothetical protein
MLIVLGVGVAAPALAQAVPGTMAVGRLHYDGGGDWYANPSALPNLIAAVRQRTGLRMAEKEKVVRLVDDDIWNVAYLTITGHGNLRWSDQELAILRRWLVAGGFLHASDNYGLDESFRREMARLFPDRPLEVVPLGHPIFHLVYEFPQGIPKIHEHDGKPAEGLGIFLDGRLAVFYDYQTDLSDGWEDPAVHRDPVEKHEAALRMGVNLIAYAVGFGGTPP